MVKPQVIVIVINYLQQLHLPITAFDLYMFIKALIFTFEGTVSGNGEYCVVCGLGC